LDAWDQSSFKEYRGGSAHQWLGVLNGLRLVKEREIPFSISFLLTEDSLRYVFKMIDMADQVCPDTVHFHNYNPHSNFSRKAVSVDSIGLWFLKEIMKGKDYSYDIVISHIFDVPSKKHFKTKCVQPWQYFLFNQKGLIAPCCHLKYDEKWGRTEDYSSASPSMVAFRENIMKEKLSESCFYCHRRFTGDNYAVFSSRRRRWYR
jgi:sulfatase maturation enzyme AslB (radical SAM superfamily)